ncbi:pirin, putative [Anopheles sinensis]|uniref:Pirin, putative n=1 Tax=Anopheles sinensis TaxID=74873 RepID=A0A084W4X5_ANOSI|nr:pirin, putative [Anopheles sinensis]
MLQFDDCMQLITVHTATKWDGRKVAGYRPYDASGNFSRMRKCESRTFAKPHHPGKPVAGRRDAGKNASGIGCVEVRTSRQSAFALTDTFVNRRPK